MGRSFAPSPSSRFLTTGLCGLESEPGEVGLLRTESHLLSLRSRKNAMRVNLALEVLEVLEARVACRLSSGGTVRRF